MDSAMKERLLSSVEGLIRAEMPLAASAAVLRDFARLGVTQTEALAALETARVGTSPDVEDRLFELMDLASGHCAPHLRVWS